jgi:AraC-like DNA-binding protein
MTLRAGFDDRVYPVNVLATIAESLAREGIAPSKVLEGVHLSARALSSHKTRVSLRQVLYVCRNAAKLSCDPHFAFEVGRHFHVSTYGLYGFAILSSSSYRQAIDFALRYHALSTPLIELSFHEEPGRAIWSFVPIAHPSIDAQLARFVIELNVSIIISLHREVMGPQFAPLEVHLPFSRQRDTGIYQQMFGCPTLFCQKETSLAFDASWLDRDTPQGNEITYHEIVKLCDDLMGQLQLRAGLAGKVRGLLLIKHLASTSAAAVAQELHMTERTLRRKLSDEQTSFRKLVRELRMHMATKYLRDTDLSVQEIAHALGFSEDAAFRHAFRRWTKSAPREFRERLKNELEH